MGVWCPQCNRQCGRVVSRDLIPGRLHCYCESCDYDYEIWTWEMHKGRP